MPLIALPELGIWRTLVPSAGFKTATDLVRVLTAKRSLYKLGSHAEEMIARLPLGPGDFVAGDELVVTSLAGLVLRGMDLDPRDATTASLLDRRVVTERAHEFGLSPCHARVGPILRWQYSDQTKGKRFFIWMEPLPDASGHPRVFVVEHGLEGQCLFAVGADYCLRHLGSSDLLVFSRTRAA